MSRWIACPSCGGQRRQRREEEWDDVLALTIIANGKSAEHIAYLTARHAALVAAARETLREIAAIPVDDLDAVSLVMNISRALDALRAALDGEPR
jgi:hypothetical protein